MNNDVVLRSIAEKLPLGSLRKLRHICTLWNSNFIPQLKKKQGQGRIWHSNDEKLAELAEVIRSSSDFPFINRFCLDFDKNSSPRSLDSFLPFAVEFGNRITSFHLDCAVDQVHVPMSLLQQLIFDYLPQFVELRLIMNCYGPVSLSEDVPSSNTWTSLPKLKQLKVDEATGCDTTVNPVLGQFVADVIGSATNLDLLKLNDASTESDPDLEQGNLLKLALARLLDVQHITKLKIFKLMAGLTHADLRTLIQLAVRAGMKLNKFEMCFMCKIGEEEDEEGEKEYSQLVHDFLATQSSTLKKLSLYLETEEDDEDVPCTVPRLENLRKLTLKSTRSTFRHCHLQFTNPAGKFVDTFPALALFFIDPEYNLRICLRPEDMSRFAHSGLTFLKIGMAVSEKESGFIQILATAFPSLKRMELTLTLDSSSETGFGDKQDFLLNVKELATIWTNFPALTSLRIQIQVWRRDPGYADLDLDAFVTGVSRTGLERLRHKLGDQSEVRSATPASLAKMVTQYKTRPSMSDKEHLQEFVLTFKPKADKIYPQLTDLGGCFGIALASPSLQRVVINGVGKNLVSEKCVEFIRVEMGLWAEIYPF